MLTDSNNGVSRRSKRRRSNSFDSAEVLITDDVPNRELSCPIGEVQCCIELGLPHRDCCNGCIQFSDREGLSINHRNHDEAMTAALATRADKHKHRDKKCSQLWKQNWEDITSHNLRDLHQRQLQFISKLNQYRTPRTTRRRLNEDDEENQDTRYAVSPSTPANDRVAQSPSKAPSKKLRTIHDWRNYRFSCQGHQFDFDLPCSHVIVPRSHLTSLQNDREALRQLKDGTKMKRFTMNASKTLKAYLAVALAAVPAFALSAASFVIPLIVTAFLQHYYLFDRIGDIANFAKTFPSESYLRKNIMDQAANNMVWLSQELDDKLVFLACDKGTFTCACYFAHKHFHSLILTFSFRKQEGSRSLR